MTIERGDHAVTTIGEADREPWPWGPFLALVVVYFVFFRFDPVFTWFQHHAQIDALKPLHQFFTGSQTGSDSLVVGRLKITNEHGVLASNLQMPAFPLGTPGGYDSQFGLSAWVLSVVARLVPGGIESDTRTLMSLVALCSASMAAAATIAIRRVLSRGAAVLLLIGLVQPWPLAFAKSIYWLVPLKCLPGAVAVFMLARPRGRWHAEIAVLVAAVLAFLSGYEYSTVVVALPLGAVVFAGVSQEWTQRALIVRMVRIGAAAASGFALAVGIHIVQLGVKYGSLSAGVKSFRETLDKRTGVSGFAVDPIYAQSLAAKPWTVLRPYLSMPVFGAPENVPLVDSVTVTGLLGICMVLVIVGPLLKQLPGLGQQWWAMVLAWLVTLLGPVGWHLLARPHSFIHTPLNFVLWFLPTVPLGLAIIWAPVRAGIPMIVRDRTSRLVVGLTVALLGLFFALSWISVR